ncbi:hypothetical protein Acor_66180 [Acrocarpospora corrugata]|uniref:Heparin-binding hemagglutinin n=1 Tax=Acrocarpospora corrugata TaxID=35763 RepID=A0A5M3W8I4_9ACTN|nr:hypothetical protein [Acrocarpospora corrugata]GES04550.1 hypothetical protein Acor_66180 [Acrocarpospora corrugata]
MTLATEVKKITESKPFYALTGAGDFAMEKLRELPDQLAKLQDRQGDAKKYAERVQDRAENYARELPGKTREYAETVTSRLTEVYDDLAKRGRKVVRKVSGGAAIELEEVAESAGARRAPARKPVTPRTKAKA